MTDLTYNFICIKCIQFWGYILIDHLDETEKLSSLKTYVVS